MQPNPQNPGYQGPGYQGQPYQGPGYQGPAYQGQPYQGQPAPYGYPQAQPTASTNASIVGLIVAAVGGAAVIIGLFTPWYSAGGASEKLKDIVTGAKADGAPGLYHLWFGWALWVVLGLTVIAAFLAVLALPVAIAMRIVAPILGILGAILTWAGLNSVLSKSHTGVFDHAAIGLWLTLLGFIVLGVGGLLGMVKS